MHSPDQIAIDTGLLAQPISVHRCIETLSRRAIRAAVYQLERAEMSGANLKDVNARIDSVAGRVGRLSRLHPAEGRALKQRIAALRLRLGEIASNQQALDQPGVAIK